ncbi:DUF688 domain-containing protein [Cephalotus follicularis]|uniref:DUF688 domain-containing protein n=1 Tax=Cephalotus follicularis TaxID=3775 RepID=A0A1Q3CVC4_CEPFO|nr:DUF688 domain-containing protein [Cephalotus follicularis]
MLLKNLMEDKQLDFNQPLLSVRRFSSSVATSEAEGKRKTNVSLPKKPPLPSYKSEMKSGPIRNPGSVPFLWEQTPGKPKDESKSQTRALKRPPITPNPPPGRILNTKQQPLGKGSEVSAASWSQTGNLSSSCQNISSSNKNVNKYEISKGGTEETGSSESEDGDDAYEDALDTLSRSESFFLNCSTSGVSGLDGPELKPSGIFSADPQTRDFMMGRFLPAAKAMAAETPQYAIRKPPVAQAQPRQIKKIVSGNKRLPLYPYCPNPLPHYGHAEASEESEDEDIDYGGPENSSVKVCGFFTRFCLKNSFCILNPVPGMRTQAQQHISLDRRTKAKSAYAGSCSETKKEHARDVVFGQKSTGLQSLDLHENKIELKNESDQITSRRDSQKVDGSTLYKQFQGNGISHYQNEFSVYEEKGFLWIPEKSKNFVVNGLKTQKEGSYNFRQLLADDSTNWQSASSSPVTEKTLYIDSVHMVKSPDSNSSSSDIKGLINYKGDDIVTPVKSGEIEAQSVDFSVKEIKNLNTVEENAILQPKGPESIDSSFRSSSDRSRNYVQMDVMNGPKQDQDLIQVSNTLTHSKVGEDEKIDSESNLSIKFGNQESYRGRVQDSNALTSSTMVDADGKIDLESQLLKKNQVSSHGSYSQSPPPPPLPKSPSDSWLKRTLPTVSSRNSWSTLGMHRYSKIQDFKTSALDPKWETIVKSTNLPNSHLQFSEELLSSIPEA